MGGSGRHPCCARCLLAAIVLVPLAGAAAAAAAEPPRRGRGLFARSVLTDCNHTVGTHHYDLSPLRGVVFTGADTTGKGRGSYNLSVCGDIPTPCRDSLTGMKSPAGLLYTLWDGEPTGTCWDVIARWEHFVGARPLPASDPAAVGAKGLVLAFRRMGDSHISCGNVTVEIALRCAKTASLRGHQTGCDWKLDVTTPSHAVCGGSLPAGGNHVVQPPYTTQPALLPQGRPRGQLFNISLPMAESRIFNGTDATFTQCGGKEAGECCIPAKGMCNIDVVRQVLVYVPAALTGAALADAPILCMQDGPGWLREVSNALDNLAPAILTPFVAVSIENGGSDAIKSERGLEYDTMSDRYARFLQTEVLPAVLRNPRVRAAFPTLAFATDPSKRGLFGCSSGGAASLTAGWFRPDLFRRIAAYSGTFVDQQDHDAPSSAEFPFGAWGYHSAQRLIATTRPRKPLRIFTHNSEFDLGYQTVVSTIDDAKPYGSNIRGDHTATNPTLHNWTDHHHNWRVAGNRTAEALRAQGYSFRHVFSKGTHHCDALAINATLADTLVWLWAEDDTIKLDQ